MYEGSAMRALLTPRDVDAILRYPSGRAARLARAGLIPCIRLPDGEIRFDPDVIDEWLRGQRTHDKGADDA